MTAGGERPTNTPDQEASLSPKEIDANAFRLIGEFMDYFRQSKSFQYAAAWVYFGQLDYGFIVRPDDARKISITSEEATWTVQFDFTEGTQSITIDKLTSKSERELSDESVRLESKRFSYQPTNPQAKVAYYDLSDGSRPVREVNNPVAIRKTEEILASLKSSS